MADELDAYSRTVSAVARTMTPHVASVADAPRQRVGRGVHDAGHLLTNAHVVGSRPHGEATYADGEESPFDVIGVDPLSDLAVLHAPPKRPSPADPRQRGRPGRRPAGRRGRLARSAWPAR